MKRLAFLTAFLFVITFSLAAAQAGESCDSCSDDCCQCGGGWFANGEMLFIKPRLGHNEAFRFSDTAAGPAQITSFRFTQYKAAPRITFGFENAEGFGARTRYFYYRDNTVELRAQTVGAQILEREISSDTGVGYDSLITTGLNDSLNAATSLELQTMDLEGFQTLELSRRSTATLAFGFRYGKSQSDLVARQFNNAGAFVNSQSIFTEFEGTGPTLAIDGRRQVGSGNMIVRVGLRQSILFGRSAVSVVDTAGDDFEHHDQHAGLFITELSSGFEWTRDYDFATVTLGAGWEGQYWSGMPLATRMGDNFDDPSDLFANGLVFSIGLLR